MAFRYLPKGAGVQRWRERPQAFPDTRPAVFRPQAEAGPVCKRDGRPPLLGEDGAMRALWLVLSFVAIVVACFGLSCLAYAYLAATYPPMMQETWGDPWNGPLP